MSRRKKKKAPYKPADRRKHNEALKDPTTRRILRDLKDAWSMLSLVRRGDRLQSLISRGCTRRGLAHELRCDEGSIRRDLEISRLPGEQRKLVDQRLNPQPFLHEARVARLTQAYQEMITSKNKREQQIDLLARLLHDVMTTMGISCSSYRWQLLDEVWYRLFDYEVRSRRFPERFPLPCPAPQNIDPQKVILDCRHKAEPAKEAEDFWFEVACEQITQALFKLAPDDCIRQHVIRRAQKLYESFYPFTIETTSLTDVKKAAVMTAVG